MDTHHLSIFLRGCALAIHDPRFAQAATLLERQDAALRAIENAPIEQVRRIAREVTGGVWVSGPGAKP